MVAIGFTHAVTTGYKSDAGTISSTVESFVGNSQEDIDESIGAGVNNAPIGIKITKANIVSLCMFGSAALTVKTNSSGAPQDTITLAPGMQTVWNTNSTAACPFAGDVTELYVSNPAATPTRFRLAVLLNS